MLADDVALKTESKATLIKAIAIVASGSPATPAARLALGEPGLSDVDPASRAATGGAGSAGTTASRVSRLLSPRPPLPEPLRATVLACCALLLAVPTALLLVPGLLGSRAASLIPAQSRAAPPEQAKGRHSGSLAVAYQQLARLELRSTFPSRCPWRIH